MRYNFAQARRFTGLLQTVFGTLSVICCSIAITELASGQEIQNTWKLIMQSDVGEYTGIDCNENGTCFIVGNSGIGIQYFILRSLDEGRFWDTVFVDNGGVGRLPLYMGNISGVVAGADSGYVFNSANGGVTWKRIKAYDFDFVSRKPRFLSASHVNMFDSLKGILVLPTVRLYPDTLIEDLLLLTDDGGGSWSKLEKQPFPEEWEYAEIVDAHRSPESTVVLMTTAERESMVATSLDDGSTWFYKELPDRPLSSTKMYDLNFVNARVGYVCGALERGGPIRSAYLAKTDDGGLTWTAKHSGPVRDNEVAGFSACYFTSDGLGYASSYGVIERTSDDGETWVADSLEGRQRGQFAIGGLVATGSERLLYAELRGLLYALDVESSVEDGTRENESVGSHIDHKGVLYGSASEARSLAVYSIGGKLVYQKVQDSEARAEAMAIPVDQLSIGCYYVQVDIGRLRPPVTLFFCKVAL